MNKNLERLSLEIQNPENPLGPKLGHSEKGEFG
jgi:hypothetical protein